MDDLLTTRQVQELLHIDRTTIYRLVASNQLPAVRVGKQWRFTRAAVASLLDRRGASLAAPAGAEPAPFAQISAHVSSTGLQQLQDMVADLLGVMLVVTDMQGHPLTEPSNACGYYRALMGGEGLGSLCDMTWPQLAAALPLKPQFVRSQLGPLCARAFIRIDNRLEGMLVAGCVAPDAWPPPDDALGPLARQINCDPDRLVESVRAVHVLSNAAQQRVLDTIQRTADIISCLIAEHTLLMNDQ